MKHDAAAKEIFGCPDLIAGRAVRADKRGAIDIAAANILERMGIDEWAWLKHMGPRKRRAPLAVGPLTKVKAFAEATGRRWIAGQSLASGLGRHSEGFTSNFWVSRLGVCGAEKR